MGSLAYTTDVFFFIIIFLNNQQSDAAGLVGLREPELPSYPITSGTGFTASAPWEWSRVPPVFGWPLSYVTEQLWNTRERVYVTVGETLGKMNNDDDDVCPVWFWNG